MHDFFDILGVPDDAPAQEIRRACARRGYKPHPDFDGPAVGAPPAGPRGRSRPPAELTDLAIDFVDMSAIAERMQSAFFGSER